MLTFATVLLMSSVVTDVPPPVASAPAAEEKLICRRQAVTGSLVTTKKTCMTKKDWAKTSDGMQKFGREMVDSLRGRPAGN